MKHTSVNEDITPIKKKEFDKNPEKYIKLGKDPLVLEEKIEEYDEEVNGKKETWVKIRCRTLGGFSLINYTGKKLSEPSKSWWHNTDFGLGWLPLGGYCAITGMVDETQGADKLNHPVQDFEFRAKPAWQRLLIMVGGVLVNFITAPLIFWFLLFGYGERYIPFSDAPMGLQFHEVMKEVGFQDGDIIVSIDGVVTETYKDIANTILFADTCTVQILRNGERMDIGMPREFYRTILSREVAQLCALRFPTVVDSVVTHTPAAEAGLLKGDSIIGVDTLATPCFADFSKRLFEMSGKTTKLVIVRNGENDTLSVDISENGKIGFYPVNPTHWFNIKTREYEFFEAFPAGISMGIDRLSNYVKQLPLIFTKEGASSIGGFGTIAKLFPDEWDWRSFWDTTALLAIILAVMNILPIPGLDGGHILFLLIEIIIGRKVPDKWLEYAQMIGMTLLILLVLYANGNDIFRYLIK